MSAFQPKQNQPSQRTLSTTTGPVPARSTIRQEHPALNLQRTIGNQAMLRLMRADAAPVRGMQRKLTVNTPGDAFEQEADRVADHVMRMSDPSAAAAPAVSGGVAGVQRACACGGTCSDCQNAQHDEHAHVQMKAAPGNAGGMEAPPIVHEVLRSPGQPLDSATRAFMEPRFGQDLSGVRVHTDSKATDSAQAVGARAYTVGSNVVFGAGEYRPNESSDRRLIAHELAHVIQQSAGSRDARNGNDTSPNRPAPVSQMPIGSGTVQCDKKPASSATMSINFTKGTMSPDDKLTFPTKRACSQDLGLFECSANRMWVWNVEIVGNVSDDATMWDVSQSLTGQRKGIVKTTKGDSVKFDKKLNVPDDTPLSSFVQQNSGEKNVFWIDSPGHDYDLDADKFDSVTQVQNFVSKVCSKTSTKTCAELKWFAKIVVKPGQKLDTKESKVGSGHTSTKL